MLWPGAGDGGAADAGSGSSAGAGGKTLCVLVHGMKGAADDWRTWTECLAEQCPTWIARPLESLRSNMLPIIGGDMANLAPMVAGEIVEAVQELQAEPHSGPEPVTLHCVGHSMGGLVLRGALPLVSQRLPDLVLGAFMTLSTPHLGVQAGLGAPEAMWRNLACLTGIASPQLPQLAIQDNHFGDERPYLVCLADREGPYVPALARFRRRVCVTMAHGDMVVPTSSGSLWTDQTWPKPAIPASQVAGWGFEAFSVAPAAETPRSYQRSRSSSEEAHSSQGSQSPRCSAQARGRSRSSLGRLSWAPRILQEGDIVWAKSADGACVFPRQILEGLEALSWERLLVRLHMPRADAHVFLIAKRAQQHSDLEHAFARACVGHLVGLLANGAVADGDPGSAEEEEVPATPPGIEAPCWQRTLEVRACPRSACEGKWTVATEEGIGMVKFYPCDHEVEANLYFDSLGVSRILFDPCRTERRRAGANVIAYSTIRRHFALPAAEIALDGKWTVATEEGSGNVKFYTFEGEEEARQAFKAAAASRILLDPARSEVARAGWNKFAHGTIRSVLHRETGGS